MKTFTGRYIDPFKLKSEDIDITDIAHHLAHICRFNGAVLFHYSVAQHSVGVASLCPGFELEGLLHDAAEAYLTDLPRPVKHSPELEFYRMLEKDVQALILRRFGLSPELPEAIKAADDAMCVQEGIFLMNEHYSHLGLPADVPMIRMTPVEAKAMFLSEYQRLMRERAIALHGPIATMH